MGNVFAYDCQYSMSLVVPHICLLYVIVAFYD